MDPFGIRSRGNRSEHRSIWSRSAWGTVYLDDLLLNTRLEILLRDLLDGGSEVQGHLAHRCHQRLLYEIEPE